MLSALLVVALWGLIIGGVAVVVQIILLTFEYIRAMIAKKLKEKRTHSVLQTSGNAILKKIAEDADTVSISMDDFTKMTNELEGTYINASLDENNNIIDDQVTHIRADKVDKSVSELGTILVTQ